MQLILKPPTLEQGAVKAIANARDLVETAIAFRSLDAISNKLGYSVLFMQTGLEEAAKASFLFEKYVRSLRKGRITISEQQLKQWIGGRRAHTKRIARVQYLYALTEQVSSIPGGSIIFPQGVQEMLQNRNAALYVDFNLKEECFKSPSEVIDTQHLSANVGFVKHLLAFTNYDKAIETIKSVILPDPKKVFWFTQSIEREIHRKEPEVKSQVQTFKKPDFPKLNLETDPDIVFCARFRSDQILELIYSYTLGTTDNTVFFMDEHTNHFAIHPDGKIIHARLARTVNTPLGFRSDWEVIGVHS